MTRSRSVPLLWGALLALVAALGAALVWRGSGEPRWTSDGPVRIVVSVPPLVGLVRLVAGPDADVRALVPPTISEHLFEPTMADVEAVRRADVVVCVGLGVDASVESITHRRSARSSMVRFCDSAGIVGRAVCNDPTHDHGPGVVHPAGHESSETSVVDGHLWMDPALCLRLVEDVARVLSERAKRGDLRLGSEADIEARLDDARTRIGALTRELDDRLGKLAGARVVTHHDAFGRLLRPRGIEVLAVLMPVAHAEHSAGDIERVVRLLREGRADALLLEPQFDGRFAQAAAERAGVAVGRLDPLGSGDWEGLLRDAALELERVLAGAPANGG